MKICVGELEVLDTGVVLSHHDLPIKFKLVHGEEEITITINFSESTMKDDKGKSIDTTQAQLVSDKEMNLVLSGWDNSLGVGANDYWELGSIGGRKLKLIVRIHGIKMEGGTQRMFAYTWLLGDPV